MPGECFAPRTSEFTSPLDQTRLTIICTHYATGPVHHKVQRVMQVLTRRAKNNPALIDEPEVGKKAIAEGLARRIVSGDPPETLKNKRLAAIDLSPMIARAKYRGEFEDREGLKTKP